MTFDNRHESCIAAMTERVDMTRDQLFAGAGFANDQRGGFAGRDTLDLILQLQRLRIGKNESRGAHQQTQLLRVAKRDQGRSAFIGRIERNDSRTA